MGTTALNQGSPASTIAAGVPHTQNTAPVLEFRCLFTPDLRRKQKRWKDGRLKFHTFNKRVMVYDDRSNFVGDTHWRKDYEFEEGEELELERGGILVEVGECLGKRDQDLTELVDKRVKEREERVAAKNAASPMRLQASLNGPQAPAGSALLRPKSLNAVLGNPIGHHGKAVISTQSPFEQRQQAIRDENENGRPAKRRKQDETPPSKHGYAQNLMGSKLTLTSSKPPSTATIKYEPLRPSIQRTPAATIDLTWEEGHRTADRARTAAPREERMVPKSQRQRPNKSPATRGGYASSITGASLNLKGPEGYSSKRSVSGLNAGAKGLKTYITQETGSFSSVESDIEEKSSEERPPKRIQTEKEPAKKRTKPSLPAPALPSRSSSPPVISRPATLLKSSTTVKNNTVQEFPASRLITDQPVSTLRIKSRAPRKMMMLMERPFSRLPAPKESSDNSHTGLRRQQIPKPAQNVVLSQATMRLDAFRELQELRLEQRLNEKRSESYSDDLSSSPADSGINHQLIDSLLFRRTEPAEAAVPAHAQKPHPKPVVNLDRDSEDDDIARTTSSKPLVYSTEAVVAADTMILKASKRSPPELNTTNCVDTEPDGPPNNTPNPKVLQQSAIPSTDGTENTVPSQSEPLIAKIVSAPIIKSSGVDSLTPGIDPEPQVAPVRDSNTSPTDGPEERASSNRLDLSQAHKLLSKTGSLDRASKTTSLQSRSPVASSAVAEVNELSPPVNPSVEAINRVKAPVEETEPSVPGSFIAARPKVASLPAHMSSAIISATAHFRAILKSSALPPNQAIQDLPSAPLEQPALPPAPVYEAQKVEIASSDVAIKALLKPSPPPAVMLISEATPVEDADSTTSIHNTSYLILPTLPNARTDQPKAKLVNPATRGLSVQMTANRTVNARVPTFNGLPSTAPPPPRISSRPGRIPAQDEALPNRSVRGLVKEVTPGGPWSRESFDLFGSWRPPGRDISRNAVNG